MNRQTAELAVAMQRMGRALEQSAVRLSLGELTGEQQVELRALLTELLADLGQHEADTPIIVDSSSADAVSQRTSRA